jgi:DNA-binding CsgD family transcriptional regulator
MLVVAEETLPVARTLDEEAYLEAVVRIGSALERQGRLTDAVASFRRAWDESRRLVLPRSSIEAGHSLARVLAELGELGEAREIAGELVELDARIGHRLKGYGSAARIVHMIDLALGDPRTALAKLRRVAEIEADPHYRIGTRQVVARWEARTAGIRAADSVERELDAARADAELARCPRCAAELRIVSAELLARIGRVEDAAELRRAWEADTPPREPIHEIWRKRAAAAIAAARGDVEEARTTLEALVDEAQAAGRTEAVLWARLDLGRLLAATDPTAAATALRSAVALANKTGAVTHRRLAEQVLRGLGVRTWRRGRRDAGAGVASLSAREREVAALVARGASNREIAETLFVTPKTVERHITNALAKLGARNRTELATRMNAGFPR